MLSNSHLWQLDDRCRVAAPNHVKARANATQVSHHLFLALPNARPGMSELLVNAQDNVFTDAKTAVEWAESHCGSVQAIRDVEDILSKGKASESVATRLVYRTLHHQKPDSEEGGDHSPRTSCLLTQAASRSLDALKPIFLPEFSMYNISPVATLDFGDLIGMHATAKIAAGSTILTEYPLVIAPACLSLAGLSSSKEDCFRSLFDRLPAPMAAHARTMQRHWRFETNRLEEGILRINGIAVQIPVQDRTETYSALFANTSKCNHRFVILQVQLLLGKTR